MKFYKKKDIQYKNELLVNIEYYICYEIINYGDNKKKLEKLLNTKITKIDYNNKELFEIFTISDTKTPNETTLYNLCRKCNIKDVNKIKIKKIYLLQFKNNINEFNKLKIKEEIFQKYHDRMIETYKILNIKNNTIDKINKEELTKNDLIEINKNYGLSFEEYDLNYILNYINTWNNKLFVLFDLSQSNSEHCRHNFFNGKLFLKNQITNQLENNLEILENNYEMNGYERLEETLFDLVKKPYKIKKNDNLVAFRDNSSVISGYKNNFLFINNETNYYLNEYKKIHFVLTAETHNFPTGICPFKGAATGIGGRIRDVQATGIGATPVASIAGYCIGSLNKNNLEYPKTMRNPIDILIEGSNGASDYGNKFGEPIICGFTRSFCNTEYDRIEWIKPIMFTAGLGNILEEHLYKKELDEGMLVCKIGGPVYNIGFGGGSASSRVSSDENNKLDYLAVQRDDPEMEQKMNRVIQKCINLGVNNPIISIHDQGAGGNGNVLKEIIEDKGAILDIGNLTMGDKNLEDIHIWLSEYQESNAIVIKKNSYNLLKNFCKREGVYFDCLGKITNERKLTIINDDRIIIDDYPLDYKPPRKSYKLIKNNNNILKNKKKIYNYSDKFLYKNKLSKYIFNVFKLVSVGSKRFLTNKVDRSVSGLIAQQQCIGPYQTPLSNYGLIATNFTINEKGLYTGCATSVGEQSIFGLIDPKSMIHKTVAEALTNLMFVLIEGDISASANWMWPCPTKYPKEAYKMYVATKELSKLCIETGIIINGGKDSLSMAVSNKNEVIKSPGSLVLTLYAKCPNIYKKITPDFKNSGNCILYIDLSESNMSMGGSSFSQIINNIYKDVPYIRNINKLNKTFELIQYLIKNDLILSGHDKSDGGLITTLCEMSLSSGFGFDIYLQYEIEDIISYLFNEEIGLVIEVDNNNQRNIINMFKNEGIKCVYLGNITNNNKVKINKYLNITISNIFDCSISKLKEEWENISYNLEKKQCLLECVEEEYNNLKNLKKPEYIFNENHFIYNNIKPFKYNLGVIRDEGSNGDKEMASAFYQAGFNVFDININDLILKKCSLKNMNGIVYVGGFTYKDVLGSAQGWVSVIKSNKHLKEEFKNFYSRNDTFSLGVCNGCQLMIKLGVFKCNIKLEQNKSKRFESRFSNIKVIKNNSIFLKNMEDMNFGMWVAHGEGRFVFDEATKNKLINNNQIPLKYLDNYNNITMKYPYNPNNSMCSSVGISSISGRHLALMPHPERSIMKWQTPWINKNIKYDYTPWFKLFKNAYEFCSK